MASKRFDVKDSKGLIYFSFTLNNPPKRLSGAEEDNLIVRLDDVNLKFRDLLIEDERYEKGNNFDKKIVAPLRKNCNFLFGTAAWKGFLEYDLSQVESISNFESLANVIKVMTTAYGSFCASGNKDSSPNSTISESSPSTSNSIKFN